MKKFSLGLGLASVSMLGLIAASGALAAGMSQSYEVTVTNTMSSELIAPILTTGTAHDNTIFKGDYVTREAEVQVLTGDPAELAAAIGKDVTIAHGTDGPPGVLLAPGKSITFTVTTEAKEIRFFAMVAPTEKPDNYLTATIALEPGMEKSMEKSMTKAMDKGGMDKAMPTAMMDDAVMIPKGGHNLMAGDNNDRVAMLRQRLGVMAAGDAMMFDDGLRSAVMKYQMEHGLTADGVVGPMTLASLNGKTMAKDTMAKDAMAKDAMAKDTMAKDTMMKDAMMQDGGILSAVLHRFDIGHDEKTMATTAVPGEFGTVSVKKL